MEERKGGERVREKRGGEGEGEGRKQRRHA